MEAGSLNPEEIVLRPSPSTPSCKILIERGLIGELGSRLPEFLSGSKHAAIVTDSNVGRLYGTKVRRVLSSLLPRVTMIEIPAGEKSKSLRTASLICDKLAKSGTDRKTVLLALGGGVVGDLTGFVASIYKRGLRYYQIPTTLLAQVDSSIGGKTGVDTNWGKNQLGTFYQPEAVFIDPTTLSSLPRTEVINGAAEITKSSIVASREMFDSLVRMEDVLSINELEPLIPATCKMKADVVSKDEKEENLRSILNFGHTVGHAIEAASNFTFSHGRSVILGMLAESWIAKELGLFERDDCEKSLDLLKRFLPSISSRKVGEILERRSRLLELALADKKSSSNTIRMSLPERIGRMAKSGEDYRMSVEKELFLRSLDSVEALVEAA